MRRKMQKGQKIGNLITNKERKNKLTPVSTLRIMRESALLKLMVPLPGLQEILYRGKQALCWACISL